MSLRRSAISAGFLCLLVSGLIHAQETGRGRRSTTGDERRGISFTTFLSRLESWSAQALAGVAKVREELALTAEQKQKLVELQTTTNEKQRELLADYQRRAAELNQQADAEILRVLDEKQNARLSQLQWQRRGVAAALAVPDVAEKLGLSAEQREKLATLARPETSRGPSFRDTRDRSAGTARGGFNPPGTPGASDFQAASARAREAREKRDAEMLAVLTPEQKMKWDEMLGAKFEFSAAGAIFEVQAAADLTARASNFELGTLRSARAITRSVARLGPAGPFRYQTIIDGLGLSEDQKAFILAIGKEDAETIGQIGASGAEATAKIEQLSKMTQEKLDKVLNEEQKTKLKALLNPQTP